MQTKGKLITLILSIMILILMFTHFKVMSSHYFAAFLSENGCSTPLTTEAYISDFSNSLTPVCVTFKDMETAEISGGKLRSFMHCEGDFVVVEFLGFLLFRIISYPKIETAVMQVSD